MKLMHLSTRHVMLGFLLHGLMSTFCDCYRFGIGIHDITGPAADVNMMGYANFLQITSGIHLRLYSRAFIIQENAQAIPILFINLDACMTTQLVKTMVIERLNTSGFPFDYENVLISSIHTHSGPGGYFEYLLYSITSLGVVKESFNALVNGIVKSVRKAHENMVDGEIFFAEGDLYNTSINRSPASYLRNPPRERSKYAQNVDTKMVMLKFVDAGGNPRGMINWFAVHPVSMNESNTLISSDNKGLASLLFESKFNEGDSVGQGPFVAAFAQSNEGDVSPNLNGPRCIDTGEPCEFVHSTCHGRVQKCIASGPGKDMFESTKIIAERQVSKAMTLFSGATEKITGPIQFVHQFVDMTSVSVSYNSTSGKTCKPAMGYSFAAGTTDGPGVFNFEQGTRNSSIYWDLVRNLIKKPSEQLVKCHFPKPIILPTGEIDYPYPWQPEIVETQILRIGNLILNAVPGEFTTMSGRRLREAVQETVDKVVKSGTHQTKHPKFLRPSDFHVVIAGLSNLYTSYVATPEEYQLQRYEGASTIYGPFTLPAYVAQYQKLADSLFSGSKLPIGPKPPNFIAKLLSLLPEVFYDSTPHGRAFGDVVQEPKSLYRYATDVVTAVFISASPRNLPYPDTFLTVERINEYSYSWELKFTDANWETKFIWYRPRHIDKLLGRSQANITWEVSTIDGKCIPGTYRISHQGVTKHGVLTKFVPFRGVSKPFKVLCEKSKVI